MATPTNRGQVEHLMAENAAGAEQTHYIVTWDVERAVVPVQRVRELLRDCELEWIAAPDVRESGALLRALKEMAEDRLLTEGYSDRQEIVWRLLRLGFDHYTRQSTIHQEQWVAYQKQVAKKGDETIQYSDEGVRHQVEPLVELYKRSYTSRDITARILSYAIHKAGGIKMREQGGMYFVPARGGEIVRKLRTFIERLAEETGLPSHLTTLEIADSERAQADMRYHSHKALVAEMLSARAKLKDMLRADRADDDGRSKVQAATVAGYLATVNEIGGRAALYRDVAKLRLAELNEALRELRGAFDSVRSGLTVDQFGPTLARVDAALERAGEAEPRMTDETDDPLIVAREIQAARSEMTGEAQAEDALPAEAVTDPNACPF